MYRGLCEPPAGTEFPRPFRPGTFLKDSKDDMVLELAVEAQCQHIVTFNRRDFAGVEQFGLQVLTPQEFLREIGEHDEYNQSETS